MNITLKNLLDNDMISCYKLEVLVNEDNLITALFDNDIEEKLDWLMNARVLAFRGSDYNILRIEVTTW